jgi:hypothetical protein
MPHMGLPSTTCCTEDSNREIHSERTKSQPLLVVINRSRFQSLKALIRGEQLSKYRGRSAEQGAHFEFDSPNSAKNFQKFRAVSEARIFTLAGNLQF